MSKNYFKKATIIKFIIFILLVAGIIYSAYHFNLAKYLTPTNIQEMVLGFGILAPIIFIGLYILAVLLFLPATPLSITAGLIFGPWWGTILTIIGATLGASGAFWIARLLGEDFVSSLLEKSKGKFAKLNDYDERLEKSGFSVVLFFRLIPLFPFNGLNFFLGLTKVRFSQYLLATAIGIIPGSFVLNYFGSSLGMLNPWHLALSIGLFLVLANAQQIYNKLRKRKGNKQEE